MTTLFANARVHTLGAHTPSATWFTVTRGRFQSLGSGPPPPHKKSVDLGGRCVVPGFVDSHIHFFQTGLDALFIDLSGATDFDTVADRLRTGARGKRSWVFAHSFEEDALTDQARLTRDDLDRVFSDRPVWVNRIDYHSAVVNSAALERLQIPTGTAGLMRDGASPNGILRAAAYLVGKATASRQYPTWIREQAVKAAVRMCVRRGITAVHALEGGPLFGDEGVHVVLRNQNRVPLDITVFLQDKNLFFTKSMGLNHVGGCILVDGSIGSYTAALDDGPKETLYETVPSLSPFVTRAHNAGAQLAFHAIGPRAIDVVLECYEKALNKNPRFDHRHRVEHFELATDAQLRRAADLGVVVAMQPAFEHFWGGPDGMYADRLGDDWQQTNRFRDILDAGLIIAGGSDANVTPPDPLLGIHAAVNHPNPAQRVTPLEALKMMTCDAAFAAFNDDRHGSIERGKEASFVVLDQDVLDIAPEAIRDIRVLQTWFKGRCVHRAGETDPAFPVDSGLPDALDDRSA